MKRFITAMLFSLTVIVCEQQTLFAPHFRDGLTAANPSDTTNSLIPIAGVNRSVPLAGTSNYCAAPKCAPSSFKLLGAAKEPNPANTDSLIGVAIIGVATEPNPATGVCDVASRRTDSASFYPDNPPSSYNGDAPFGLSDRDFGDQDRGAGLWSCHFD